VIPSAFGGNRQSGPLDVATAVNAHGGPHGRLDFESETFVVPIDMRQASRGEKLTNNRPEGSSGGAPGHGVGDPGDPAFTVSERGQAIAFSCKDHGADAGETAPTLRAMGHDGSHANAGGQVAVAFDARQSDVIQYGNKTGPLDTDGHTMAVAFAQNSRDELVESDVMQSLKTAAASPVNPIPQFAKAGRCAALLRSNASASWASPMATQPFPIAASPQPMALDTRRSATAWPSTWCAGSVNGSISSKPPSNPTEPRMSDPRSPSEFQIHCGVADALRMLARPGVLWTHFPSGESRDARTGAKLKHMGLQPGWPDFIIIVPGDDPWSRSRICFLELENHTRPVVAIPAGVPRQCRCRRLPTLRSALS
jgi:hypothetical protein